MLADPRSLSISRRKLALASALSAAVVTLTPARSIFAAARQSPAGVAALDYPALPITVTDDGYEGLPAEIAAGRYLLTVTGKTTEIPGIASFMAPPFGTAAADFMAQAGIGAANQSDDEGGEAPLIIYQATFAGGAQADLGGSATAVVDLTPGEWIVWGDDPAAPQKPAVFTVSGEFPAEVHDPEADIAVTLVDFGISFAGNLTAGDHILRVQHHGAQPHFLEIMQGPDSMTREQMQANLDGQMSGTPAANALTDDDFGPETYTGFQSIGTVTWHPLTLAAGKYLAICWFPTAGTGLPHAMNGMFDVFTVTG